MNANFEQYAREQLAGHETRVDTEALWADIYPHVKPENGSRKILWFFISGVFIMLTGFGFYFYNVNNSNIVASPNLDVAAEVNAPVILNAVAEDASKEATISKTASAIQNTTKEISTTQSGLSTKASALAQSTKAKNSGNKGVNLVVSNKPENLNTSIVSGLEIGKDKVDLSGNNLDEVNATLISERKNYLSTAKIPTLFPENIEYDQLRNLGISAYKPALKPTLAGNIFPPKDDMKKRKNKPDILRDIKFGVGLYTGLSRSSSDLEAKTEAAETFVIARTVAEKQLETIHLGLNVFVQTDKGIYLRTGAEYTRIGSLFSRDLKEMTMDTTQGIVEYQINSITGDTTFILGDVIVTRTTTYNKKSYNYFHLVDVPVIFGYNFGENDDDWRIGVEAGVYANVFIKSKGEIPLEDRSYYDIGDDQNKWYKTNIGISPYVGINVAYNFSQNLQIHATPSFRFNSIYSTDTHPIKEKHGSLGVQAGIRYFFD